jgi:hypothetical protein
MEKIITAKKVLAAKENPKKVLKKIPVQITELDMPFMSMVFFMVKWAFATIPAALIIWTISAFIIRIIIQNLV